MRRNAPPLLVAALLLAPAAAPAGETPQKAPSPAARGKLLAWKSADGLAYEYHVPEKYDPKAGAALTVFLHGSNLDRRWTFLNHKPGEIRPDDLVLSPDGTTPNGRGGFNFLGEKKDADRLHALLAEWKKAFKVKQVFLYGHSQGSFFSLFYAGQYPDEVDGVCAHASGVWTWTQAGEKGHRQAIALMHGNRDPVVPYAQSAGALDFYRDEMHYPLTHFRTLEGWNHWPAQFHTNQVLAWCEGVTSPDPARVLASLDTLATADEQEWIDFAALHAVAKRLASMDGAPASARERGAAALKAVEDLAAKHADVLRRSIGKEKGDRLVKAPWVGHLGRFLEDFDGVPAREDLAKEWERTRKDHREKAIKSLRKYYQQREKDRVEAFAAAVEAIRTGFLYFECPDPLPWLKETKKDAAKLKIGKAALKGYEETVPVFEDARADGVKEHFALNKSAYDFR